MGAAVITDVWILSLVCGVPGTGQFCAVLADCAGQTRARPCADDVAPRR